MKAWVITVALAGALVSSGVMADGTQLLMECQAAIRVMDNLEVEGVKAGVCIGTIQSVEEMVAMLGKDVPKDMAICLPTNGANGGQAIRIVTKYLENNPKQLHFPSALLTSMALSDAFHCN